MSGPLSPGEALAVAAILTTHPRRLPHWADWAQRLADWAHTHITRERRDGDE